MYCNTLSTLFIDCLHSRPTQISKAKQKQKRKEKKERRGGCEQRPKAQSTSRRPPSHCRPNALLPTFPLSLFFLFQVSRLSLEEGGGSPNLHAPTPLTFNSTTSSLSPALSLFPSNFFFLERKRAVLLKKTLSVFVFPFLVFPFFFSSIF